MYMYHVLAYVVYMYTHYCRFIAARATCTKLTRSSNAPSTVTVALYVRVMMTRLTEV